MSGLRKQKQYDWKDSNLALFGSDTEKQVKKESAESEPAWEGAKDNVGLRIWRIVKFQVQDLEKEDYGNFYNGDSYIVLNAYKVEEKILYDVHFWIGEKSTQDEYGTAAYKTVELDTLLDDAAVQHREVQGHESSLFNSYFPNGITILKGGADSGFRHVQPEEYAPRLLHFHGKGRHVAVVQVPRNQMILKDDDVFILDCGTELFEWIGRGANKDEKFKAMAYLQQLESDHNGAKSTVLEQDGISDRHPFYEKLDEEVGDDFVEEDEADTPESKKLFKVTESGGDVDISEVKAGDISMEDLNSADVFVIDNLDHVFVYVGSEASTAEKHNGMSYANKYLLEESRMFLPITVVKEGSICSEFECAISA